MFQQQNVRRRTSQIDVDANKEPLNNPFSLPFGRPEFVLESEDGLMNRCLYIRSGQERKRCGYGLVKDECGGRALRDFNAMPTTTALKGRRWAFRVLWRLITVNGNVVSMYAFLTSGMQAMMTTMGVTAMVMTMEHLKRVNISHDETPNQYREWAYYIGIMLFVGFIIKMLKELEWVWFVLMHESSQRMRRVRFEHIGREIHGVDPRADDHDWEYNSEDDDPDAAATVFAYREEKESRDIREKKRGATRFYFSFLNFFMLNGAKNNGTANKRNHVERDCSNEEERDVRSRSKSQEPSATNGFINDDWRNYRRW